MLTMADIMNLIDIDASPPSRQAIADLRRQFARAAPLTEGSVSHKVALFTPGIVAAAVAGLAVAAVESCIPDPVGDLLADDTVATRRNWGSGIRGVYVNKVLKQGRPLIAAEVMALNLAGSVVIGGKETSADSDAQPAPAPAHSAAPAPVSKRLRTFHRALAAAAVCITLAVLPAAYGDALILLGARPVPPIMSGATSASLSGVAPPLQSEAIDLHPKAHPRHPRPDLGSDDAPPRDDSFAFFRILLPF